MQPPPGNDGNDGNAGNPGNASNAGNAGRRLLLQSNSLRIHSTKRRVCCSIGVLGPGS